MPVQCVLRPTLDTPENSLYHFGILGMKWGKRNGPPYPLSSEQKSAAEKHHRKSSGVRTTNDEDSGARKHSMTDSQKKALKFAAAVAVAGVATYGAYKLGAFKNIDIEAGKKKVGDMLMNGIDSKINQLSEGLGKLEKLGFNMSPFDDGEGSQAGKIIDLSSAGEHIFGSTDTLSQYKDFSDLPTAEAMHAAQHFNQTHWMRDLTDSERTGIVQYTSYWYDKMNTALREGIDPPDSVKQLIDGATEGLAKWTAREDFVAYRGACNHWTANLLGLSDEQLSNPSVLQTLIGKTVEDKGFMSCGITKNFSWPGAVKYKVMIPKGTSGMYVDPISANQGEKEFLLNRGTKFVVKGMKLNGSGALKELVLEAILPDASDLVPDYATKIFTFGE